MARVTLVNLNRIQVPPIGPYAIDILGSALEEAGHDVGVLDLTPAEDPMEAIDSYFQKYVPDLVGMSLRNTGDVYFPSFLDLPNKGSFLEEHQMLISRIRMHVPAEKMILGGVGFSSNAEKLLKRFGLKYGVVGPGDAIIVGVANAIDEGKSIKEFGNCDEGVFDGRKSQLARKIKRKFIDNKWYYKNGGLGNVRTSNGCGMSCSYCIEPTAKGKGFNTRKIADVMEEIDQLVAMGINDIHTADSEFNMPITHSKEVLRAIIARRYPNNVRFWTYCQPHPFDEEYASLLAKANFVGANFGVDHADPEVLKSLGKWFGREHIANATNLCKDNGIAVMHELIFGYPGDTPKKMFETIEFAKSLDPWVIGVVVGFGVLNGTKLAGIFQKKVVSGESLDGFYVSGEPLTDPVFYADPSFKIPEIFDELRDYVGRDIYRIMIPQMTSKSGENNQLVGSERVMNTLQSGKTGAYWYHYRNYNSVIEQSVPAVMLQKNK